MKLSIDITGHTTGDLETAIEEVMRLVSEGNLSGKNENDTGGFRFDIEGEEIAYYKPASDADNEEAEGYGTFDEAMEAANGGEVIGYNDMDSEVERFSQA